jgi:hypothetical protein
MSTTVRTNEGEQTMFTRQQYLDKECTHRQFYGQMVTDATKWTVLQHIGMTRLLASEDAENLNDIPLGLWDALPATSAIGATVRATGDYLTLAGKVCVYKEAARQIIEAEQKRAPMVTQLNGKDAPWTPELYAAWERIIAESGATADDPPVGKSNYFTPRPYVDEYNTGSHHWGFTYTRGREVYQVMLTANPVQP